ncbi:MAG: signal peptidase I [Pirellulaceae bacterium]
MSSSKSRSASPSPGQPEVLSTEYEKSTREAVESIVVAIVLAFLFRAFEAEAFVIPTGSMAPSLQGMHKHITCPECGYEYKVGDSQMEDKVVATLCPSCFFTEQINPMDSKQRTHTGDRILVNKFAYEDPFGEPKRWDIIVFKFPGNAKQNYIKRLVGLPGEELYIRAGDVYVRQPGEEAFTIAQKPPHKIKAMLQLVSDSNFRSETLNQIGFPTNWESTSDVWSTLDQGESYECQASNEVAWLRYQHYAPSFEEWQQMLQTGQPIAERRPITDFYAYNSKSSYQAGHAEPIGHNWVGDLALECQIEVDSSEGQIVLDLVKAGRHHLLTIDVSTGKATLEMDSLPFDTASGSTVQTLQADTLVKGAGTYRLCFSNLDNQLTVWVNNGVVSFDESGSYSPPELQVPRWSAADPGDLTPVRIGLQGTAGRVRNLRVLRDVYYTNGAYVQEADVAVDQYQVWSRNHRLAGELSRHVPFSLSEDQFFPMGDNSPHSSDARIWDQNRGPQPPIGNWVHRDYLIGKAVFVYWPAPVRATLPGVGVSLPVFPNFSEMRLIR